MRMKFIAALGIITSSISLTSCARQSASVNELLQAVQINSDLTLRIYKASKSSPSYFTFTNGDQELYREPIGRNEKITAVSKSGPDETDSDLTQITASARKKSDSADQPDSYCANLTDEGVPAVAIERRFSNRKSEAEIFLVDGKIRKIDTIALGPYHLQLHPVYGERRSDIYVDNWLPDYVHQIVAPVVILHWTGDQLEVDSEVMRSRKKRHWAKMAPKAAIIEQFKRLPEDGPAPEDLANEALEMYYSGEVTAAREFVDSCWQKTDQERKILADSYGRSKEEPCVEQN